MTSFALDSRGRIAKMSKLNSWVRDTVASVGIVTGRTLPYTRSNKSVKTFRHALSLDERRVRFQTYHFHSSNDPECAPPTNAHGKTPTDTSSLVSKKENFQTYSRATKKAYLPEFLNEKEEQTDIREVWFAGCHSDVGGGAVENDKLESLANVPLRWMVREVRKSEYKLQWNEDVLAKFGICKDPVVSYNESQKKLDDSDSLLQPMADELKKISPWWLLEIMPFYAWQDAEGKWHRKFGIHCGKGREIDDEKPNFHSSVKHRMTSVRYKPEAIWKRYSESYVDE